MTQQYYQAAIAAFDQANAQDPNSEMAGAVAYPKELLYSRRMGEMQQRYAPDASEAVRLAVRAQHIRRWQIARDSYAMDRQGYLQWRTALYKFHAQAAGGLMRTAGYGDEMIERVAAIIGKKGLKVNPEAQLMEDVAGLVFLEHYMQAFADKHPEYDEAKWAGIIRKTWQKMSADAHAFVLAGRVKLPETLTPLIMKAIR